MIAYKTPYIDVNEEKTTIKNRIEVLEEYNNIPYDLLYHNVCLIEISKRTQYAFMDRVNKGGTSLIYQGMNRDKQEVIIIKELKTTVVKKVFREINILEILKEHPNIIKLDGFFKKKGNYYLAFPFIKSEMQRRIFYNFNLEEAKIFMKKFLETINYIHSKKIIHRDVKPGNLLFWEEKPTKFKIIDFGISDFYVPFRKYNPFNGTKNFKAPEQLLDYQYLDYGIDVWATGVMYCEIIFKKFPFFSPRIDDKEISDSEMLSQIIVLVGYDNFDLMIKDLGIEIPNEITINPKLLKLNGFSFSRYLGESLSINSELEDFLKLMLEINPKKRGTCEDILNMKYFSRF